MRAPGMRAPGMRAPSIRVQFIMSIDGLPVGVPVSLRNHFVERNLTLRASVPHSTLTAIRGGNAKPHQV